MKIGLRTKGIARMLSRHIRKVELHRTSRIGVFYPVRYTAWGEVLLTLVRAFFLLVCLLEHSRLFEIQVDGY